jgi:hypothetical protein
MMFKSVLVALLVLGSVSVAAQDAPKVGLGLKLGTTGVGLELSHGFGEKVVLRGGYSVLTIDETIDDTDVTYDAELKKDNLSLLLDWHPWAGAFRLTGGVHSHSDNSLEIIAQPATGGVYTINGTTYTANNIDTLEGVIGLEKTTPYLGIGWGHAAKAKGFTFLLDVGLQFQDSPDVKLSVNTCGLSAAVCAQLNRDIQAEVVQLEQDIEDYEFWPVVNLSLHFRF